MHIDHEIRGKYMLVKAKGRLDVTWAEHFAAYLFALIRQGHHQVLLDASEIPFLSSAGIRSLMRIYKELRSVEGSIGIIQATPFVKKTMETSGLKSWIWETPPLDFPYGKEESAKEGLSGTEVFLLKENAKLHVECPVRWRPWQVIQPGGMLKVEFSEGTFSIGIGSAAENSQESLSHLGDFMAIDGNVIYQPPDQESQPDYLLSEEAYIPHMQVVQATICQGEMSHLIRFKPDKDTVAFNVSEIADLVLRHTKSTAAGFVVLGEVEGLVGAYLIKSPGMITEGDDISYPGMRDWVSFCGERAFAKQEVLLFGIVRKSSQNKGPGEGEQNASLTTHVHAAVYPYQPLQNGYIEMKPSLQKFLQGPAPLALWHLIDDDREGIGLGESALLRGACWCAAIENQEDLL